MTMKPFFLLMLCLLAGTAYAQAQAPKSPADVTLSQITHYQTGIESGCRDSGVKNGGNEKNVGAFCECVINALKADVSDDEWRRALVFSAGGNYQEEAKILDAHLEKTRSCRAGPK